MTTVKSPLDRKYLKLCFFFDKFDSKIYLIGARPLSRLTSVRASTPLKSALSSIQPILPNIVSSTILQKHRTKKRVRFALKLEPVEEDSPLILERENSVVAKPKSNKRVIDPWREDGPLYGAYIEYLETKDALTPEIIETNRPSTAEPDVEPPTYTHTFLIQSKSPEMVIDSIRVSTPTRHLPRILHRITANKKTDRKSASPVIDSYLKQRINSSTPTRHIQSKKVPNTVCRNQITSKYPTVKRADLALPVIKTLNSSNEKVIRSDRPIETNIVNEFIHTKKLTEIITNPLPGTNNQISGHSILPNLSKTARISYQNQVNNKPCVFQNHNNDHFQHIIHSTH